MDEQKQFLEWFNELNHTKISWLWEPYIPFGKISVLQGDPGCGKSMLVTDIISRLTAGIEFPDGRSIEPVNVIYQCSEDGLSDTIKPRLERAGADCSKVACINEDLINLTLSDEKFSQAIQLANAKLVVIDPFQAYIGDSDLSNVSGMRRVMSKLSLWAADYDCAIVLVGHLNKKSGQKELYRGLGSVDIVASARSVMQIENAEDGSSLRVLRHVKSSLSTKGDDLYFDINSDGQFCWIEDESQIADAKKRFLDDCFNGEKTGRKIHAAANVIYDMLSDGPRAASLMNEAISEKGIGERTIKSAKKKLGIISVKKGGQWYWALPGTELLNTPDDDDDDTGLN